MFVKFDEEMGRVIFIVECYDYMDFIYDICMIEYLVLGFSYVELCLEEDELEKYFCVEVFFCCGG